MTSTPPLRQTPLASRHIELGARMVDFGGWEMPIHYGSQIDEHNAVRQAAGMFDVSHMCVIDVQGNDARPFLRTVLANNVDKLQLAGKALYSCMLNPQGGILDDLIVYFESNTRYRLIVNAATALHDLAWLAQQVQLQSADVALTPRRFGDEPAGAAALAIIAVQGPQARARCWQAMPRAEAAAGDLKPFHAIYHADPRFGEVMIARTGYTGEDGHELILPADRVIDLWNELLSVGVRPAGLGARDTLRLEAGMNLYGQDMDERTSPLDCGLGWTVDLDASRNFVGKAALREQGQRWKSAGLIALDRAGVLRSGQQVETPAGEGVITSGSFSPTMNQSIGLARLPLDVETDAEVHVLIRGKTVRARVVQPPFVRNGRIKV
ncbi:glycine cleavage system aminomethyltransferase GcvT [Pusillimonas sp.]|uniref:glycine cleavage system aminomethyltransferase GcvT n=1 Tax=Pusillimonas sp. TaxID=3040095 RepID=UPI0037CC2186